MATRQQLEQQKNKLLHDLRRNSQEASVRPGDLVPPVRELASRYGISSNVAHQLVQQLIGENVLYTVAGVGTFMGRRQTQIGEFYLFSDIDSRELTSRAQEIAERLMQNGFANRIAELGGASLSLTPEAAREAHARGELPSIAGIYGTLPDESYLSVPHVAFFGHVVDKEHSDAVSYDDVDGGRQATQHLISLGHRQIAFLGAHVEKKTDAATDPYSWSADREEGWRQTLQAAGINWNSLAFHPMTAPLFSESSNNEAGRFMARFIAARRDITAVVAANDYLAQGLFSGLQEANVAPERWPAVVGFDNISNGRGQMLSSLLLPSDTLGRAAADLLWERRHGQLTGSSHHRRVRMCLLPRLSSRAGWPTLMSFDSFTGGNEALTELPALQLANS